MSAGSSEQQEAFENPDQWMATNLKDVISAKDCGNFISEMLSTHGFKRGNTVACVSVCRDEMCQPLLELLSHHWGMCFNLSSLAGMLTLGKTGLSAAMHHAPVENGKERYLFCAFSHIAVDVDGVGVCSRIGRTTRSNACGALCAFRTELKSGHIKTQLDPIDPEFSMLKQALIKDIQYGTVPDLLSLTISTAKVILEDLEALIKVGVDTNKSDYAVLVGVQCHKHDGVSRKSVCTGYMHQYEDFIYPMAFYCVTDGNKTDLKPALLQRV